MENNKYFTPDIEDLCVGYECEINNIHGKWESITITFTNSNSFYKTDLAEVCLLVEDKYVRVPYLTKEQIEAEGWEYKNRSTDLWFERKQIFLRKDGYHLENIKLQYGLHDYRLKISFVYVGDDEESTGAYLGECKDINTFRKIIKLLEI